MDVAQLATRFSAGIPGWVLAELGTAAEVLATLDDRMALVNRLASRNYREGGGGPFAAIVVETPSGRLLSAGVNQVLAANLSVVHAEVMAISLAQTHLGTWDLGRSDCPSTQLLVNWRPCVQCYGAVLWSGVAGLVIAGQGPELEALTSFDEGPMRADWEAQLAARGVDVVVGVRREEAVQVFREYGEAAARGDAQVYNARPQRARPPN